ncbi:MAG: hypothetical protein ACFBSC_21405 [Microcoleaceae cyanobacterium]
MRIGWFLNAQGAGHRNRLTALLPYFSATTQLMTLGCGTVELHRAGKPLPHLKLPAYNTPIQHDYLREQVWREFHGLQMNAGGNAPFFAELMTWIADWRPDLMVVDVALEAALAARLCGVPVVYVRQHGKRWDLGHRIAYEASLALLAPFSSEMEQADCPKWIKQKTFYAGGFCRFRAAMEAEQPICFKASGQNSVVNVVVILGSGGTNIGWNEIRSAAVATPAWSWFVLGHLDNFPEALGNITNLGRIPNVYSYLCHADLVIANAGHNTVMEIGAARAPFLCWPAQRPFKEQLCKAAVLEALDLAVVRYQWPPSETWPDILTAARQKSLNRWQSLLDDTSPQRTAQFIESLCQRCSTTDNQHWVEAV